MVCDFAEVIVQSYSCRPIPLPPPQPGTNIFLACSSQLKEFKPSQKVAVETWTSNDAFIQCAKKYMLCGASFDTICDHNAQVCDFVNRTQLAQSWYGT